MASVGNLFDPAKIANAMRVQFMQLHLSESRQRGRVALAATTAAEGSRRPSDAWYENAWGEGWPEDSSWPDAAAEDEAE